MGQVVLETEKVSKKYGRRVIVDQLSLTIERGDIFGFLGQNGAGKSTTIRMAVGLVRPTSGRITVCGFDISRRRTLAPDVAAGQERIQLTHAPPDRTAVLGLAGAGSIAANAQSGAPPDLSGVLRFQQVLCDAGYSCFIRRRRGDDVSAACGQLALLGAKPKVRVNRT